MMHVIFNSVVVMVDITYSGEVRCNIFSECLEARC